MHHRCACITAARASTSRGGRPGLATRAAARDATDAAAEAPPRLLAGCCLAVNILQMRVHAKLHAQHLIRVRGRAHTTIHVRFILDSIFKFIHEVYLGFPTWLRIRLPRLLHIRLHVRLHIRCKFDGSLDVTIPFMVEECLLRWPLPLLSRMCDARAHVRFALVHACMHMGGRALRIVPVAISFAQAPQLSLPTLPPCFLSLGGFVWADCWSVWARRVRVHKPVGRRPARCSGPLFSGALGGPPSMSCCTAVVLGGVG